MFTETSSLLQLLAQFVQAPPWDESQRIVEEHPELLSDEADVLLGQLAQENDGARTMVENLRKLLHHCREVGIPRAFAEKILTPETLAEAERKGLAPEEFLAAQRAAARMPPELRARLETAQAQESVAEADIPDEVRPLQEELERLARITDMPRRVEVCRQALRMVEHDANPRLWATLQEELGSSLAQNPQGNRAENLEAAIAAYEQALQVVTRQAMPIDWAQIMNNMAHAYYFRIRGDKAENLEVAIATYEQALQVVTRQAMPIDWATTMNNLALAYYSRIRGDKAENLEAAIAAYQQALQVRTRQAMPIEWAQTMNNLALAYADRIRGDKAENLEAAIAAYQQALQMVTCQAMPIDWATTMNNLALAYADRIRGDKAENLEAAIAAYQQALQVMNRQAMPIDWAQTMMNLANAHADRIRGDKAENLEAAIAAYQQALQVRTRQAMPIDWAQTMNNLALAYADRIRGDKAENLEAAIATYEQALQVRTRQAMPIDWATTMNNLALAYYSRIRGDKAENLEAAIAAYQQALQVRTRQAMPIEWAQTMNNLALAYADRIRGDKAENLEAAIAAYQQALQVMNRQAMPIGWATTMNNLAHAHADRIRGDKAENLEAAIAAYQQTLNVFTSATMPDDHRHTQRGLGDAFFAAQCWTQAVAAYRQTLAVSNQLYAAAPTPEARQAELAAIQAVPARLAVSLYQQSPQDQADLCEAVLTLERGRARWLAESLALAGERPAGLSDDRWQSFIATRQRVQELQAESRLSDLSPDKYVALSSLLAAAREQLQSAISSIRAVAPNFMPESSFTQIQAAAQAAPLVYLLTTAAGGLALIVDKDEVQPVWLDGLTGDAVREWVVGANFPTQLGGWLGAYQRKQSKRTEQAQAWLTTVDDITHKLWSQVMGPVAAALRQQLPADPATAPEVTLIPAGLLALLPLHAAWTEDATAPTQRHYFLDDFTVRYAPSALALHYAHGEAAMQPDQYLLAIDEPKPVDAIPLPSAQFEVDAIAPLFETPVVKRHEQANLKEIREALPPADVVHFACHGANNWDNPLESGLYMAHDQLLTVRDLLGLEHAAGRLAVLSACETGIVGIELPDEVVALPSALLQVGFGGVVASLWSVADVSTAMLMARFYEYWHNEGLTPAQALRAAQCWLRDTSNQEKGAYFKRYIPALAGGQMSGMHMPETVALTFFSEAMSRDMEQKDFAHPVWWAAFYLTGV